MDVPFFSANRHKRELTTLGPINGFTIEVTDITADKVTFRFTKHYQDGRTEAMPDIIEMEKRDRLTLGGKYTPDTL
jgi:hypothetical protein